METLIIIGICAVLALVSGYLFGGFDWFHRWFGDSETLVLARLQVLIGVVMAADLTPVLPSAWLPWYVLGAGILGEVSRRLRAEDV